MLIFAFIINHNFSLLCFLIITIANNKKKRKNLPNKIPINLKLNVCFLRLKDKNTYIIHFVVFIYFYSDFSASTNLGKYYFCLLRHVVSLPSSYTFNYKKNVRKRVTVLLHSIQLFLVVVILPKIISLSFKYNEMDKICLYSKIIYSNLFDF